MGKEKRAGLKNNGKTNTLCVPVFALVFTCDRWPSRYKKAHTPQRNFSLSPRCQLSPIVEGWGWSIVEGRRPDRKEKKGFNNNIIIINALETTNHNWFNAPLSI